MLIHSPAIPVRRARMPATLAISREERRNMTASLLAGGCTAFGALEPLARRVREKLDGKRVRKKKNKTSARPPRSGNDVLCAEGTWDDDIHAMKCCFKTHRRNSEPK